MIKKICFICHNDYEVFPSRDKITKYCSIKCRRIAVSILREKKIRVYCSQCHKLIIKIPSKKWHTNFCNNNCKAIFQSQKLCGNKSYGWRGGIKYDRDRKLIYAPTHPKSDSGKYCYEYHLIMEKHLGRYLNDDEVVHHIDGDVTNNSIKNLQVLTRIAHARIHNKGENNPRYIDGRRMKQELEGGN
jgi:endogenous inhibitor of DNA gyrase (YacG/DUF329 family)